MVCQKRYSLVAFRMARFEEYPTLRFRSFTYSLIWEFRLAAAGQSRVWRPCCRHR